MSVARSHEGDWRLAQRVRTGDTGAVNEFARRLEYAGRVLTARNQRLGRPLDTAELEDVAQEAVVLLWGKLATYAGHAALETWIYPFCVNALANAVRKKRRRQGLAAQAARAATESQPTPAAAPEDLERVHDALARLGPPAEHVIRMKIYDEFTFDQIADRFAVPPETVKSWYYRGLKRLHAMLGAGGSRLDA